MFLKAIYDELFPVTEKSAANAVAQLQTLNIVPNSRADASAELLPCDLSTQELKRLQERQTQEIESMQTRLKEIQDLLVGLMFVSPVEADDSEKSYPLLRWFRDEFAIVKSLSAGNQLRDQNYARFANKVMAIQSAVLSNVETTKIYLEDAGLRPRNELEFQLEELRDDIKKQINKSRAGNNFIFSITLLLVLVNMGLFLWEKFPSVRIIGNYLPF